MAGPSKYPAELREHAMRLVVESKQDYPSEFEAIRSITAKLGIGWVAGDTAQVDSSR